MSNPIKAAYMADFERYNPTMQRRHITLAVAFLLRLLAGKQEPLAFDDPDVIDGECTQGGVA